MGQSPSTVAAVALARALPHGRLRTLPWAGHLPSLERHDEIGQLMTDFLAGDRPA